MNPHKVHHQQWVLDGLCPASCQALIVLCSARQFCTLLFIPLTFCSYLWPLLNVKGGSGQSLQTEFAHWPVICEVTEPQFKIEWCSPPHQARMLYNTPSLVCLLPLLLFWTSASLWINWCRKFLPVFHLLYPFSQQNFKAESYFFLRYASHLSTSSLISRTIHQPAVVLLSLFSESVETSLRPMIMVFLLHGQNLWHQVWHRHFCDRI